jgi:hypothetical protein
MKKGTGVALAATLLMAAVGTASAAVNFNEHTGEGFAGKGDVQTVFGWNNGQLQANASGTDFVYRSTTTYDVECAVNGLLSGGLRITRTDDYAVDADVANTARLQQQVSGWYLNGFSGSMSNAPQLGVDCSLLNPGGNPVGGTVVRVTPLGSVGSGLYAGFGGDYRQIF